MRSETREEGVNLLDEARELGRQCAWLDNREMDTGVVGLREVGERLYALDRLADIANVVRKEAAEAAFGEGYDATIDFSLNTEWRNELAGFEPPERQ